MQGARGQLHQIEDRKGYPPYEGYCCDDDFYPDDSDFHEEATPSVPECDANDTDASRAFGPLVGALSGAIVGFFCAGFFDLAVATFVALAVGGILGWLGRGVAE